MHITAKHTKIQFLITGEEYSQKSEACRARFNMEDRPLCCALEKALTSFKVHCEAYYGGTFTGSHAHKTLQICYTLFIVHMQ